MNWFSCDSWANDLFFVWCGRDHISLTGNGSAGIPVNPPISTVPEPSIIIMSIVGLSLIAFCYLCSWLMGRTDKRVDR